MIFNECKSLIGINIPSDIKTIDEVVFLDAMNFNQIEFCKKNNLIYNIKQHIANELNICSFYAIIPEEMINEFYKITT
jgi:hypothetical protein